MHELPGAGEALRDLRGGLPQDGARFPSLPDERERERESGEVSDINALLLRAALYQSRVEVDADGKKQLVIELGE